MEGLCTVHFFESK